MKNIDEIQKECDRVFATHKATLIQNTDRYLIIDWRREDGSSNYYINYIVDKKRGSLIVSGDLGDSVATWYSRVNPADLKKWIKNDIDYYLSKMQCTSDDYAYDTDDIVAEIKEQLKFCEIDEIIEAFNEYCSYYVLDEDELWEHLKNEVSCCINGPKFVPSKSLIDFVSTLDTDYYEWLYDCGKSVAMRVYLWAAGFYKACEQLNI